MNVGYFSLTLTSISLMNNRFCLIEGKAPIELRIYRELTDNQITMLVDIHFLYTFGNT